MSDDTRMRYEQSHPMPFTGQKPADPEDFAKRWDAIDWGKGEPNQAKKRKTYPQPKAHGKF